MRRLASKRLLVIAALLTLVPGATGFGPPTLTGSDPFSPRIGTAELIALQSMPTVPATVRAAGAVVLDAESDHVLVSRNGDARLAPASLTKMMTALVALDRAPLTEMIRATERSLSEPTIIGLDPGETMPLEHMLYGLLLNSGNDAALAIAETLGTGSIDRFVGWMNDRAQAMGLKNTRFANPNGLDQAGHYSSARDLAEIARAVMAEPTLVRIVSTRRFVVEGPPLYVFFNSNPLLGEYDGLDGVKTGFTDDAGPCLAASAVRNGRRLVSVVLNSSGIAAETMALLDVGFATAQSRSIDVARPGFAGVRDVGASTGGHQVIFAGWELPFLRAFTAGGRTTISLSGRRLMEW
jgi:serine-type D-Ala-D-Ala carboxypeptidase (penicillin-binding protein 5/6)